MNELKQGRVSSPFRREELTVVGLGLAGVLSQFLSFRAPPIGYLALPLVSFLPGYSLTRHLAPGDIVSRILTGFPASLMISSFYGLLLAELGVLGQITISIGLFLMSVIFIFIPRQTRVSTDEPPMLTRKGGTILLAAIFISAVSNLGLLILFQFPVGYDVWSYMATSKLIASSGSMPFWLAGSIGQVNFYPPLFPVYMASLLLVTQSSTISLFWATPIFFGGFFVLSVFGYVRGLFARIDTALVAALMAATIGSARFEGLDRSFPVSAAMITLPAFLLTVSYFRKKSNSTLFLVSSGYLAFLWLSFPPASLMAVVILTVDSLRRQVFSPNFLTCLKVSGLSIVPAVAYYLPFLFSFGVPKNTFFAPWTSVFQNATIFSPSFLVSLFNYSGLIIPTAFLAAAYGYFRKSKLRALGKPILSWTITSMVLLIIWELLIQARLDFFGAMRFVPFVVVAVCILGASWLAPLMGLEMPKPKHPDFSHSIIGLGLIILILASSATITANANYHEWLPPSGLPVSSSYYQAIAWIRDNSTRGAVVLTLDPLAQSLLEVVAGKDVHTTYDVTTYPFWVPDSVVKAYSDTVTMLSGNASSIRLLSSYNVSYVLITDQTITLLSSIKGVSGSQVETLLTTEFANATKFRLVYSSLGPTMLSLPIVYEILPG